MYRPLADAGIARRLVEAAGAAPSVHNTQPWRFRVAGDDLLEIHGDRNGCSSSGSATGQRVPARRGAGRTTSCLDRAQRSTDVPESPWSRHHGGTRVEAEFGLPGAAASAEGGRRCLVSPSASTDLPTPHTRWNGP